MEKENKTRKKYHPILVTAIVLGTLLLFVLMLAFLPKIYDCCILGGDSLAGDGWEGLTILGMFLGYVIGYVVVWFNRLIAGVIFCITAIAEMAVLLIIDGNTGSLIFGLPILLVGILFIASRYVQR
jgi:hypothetical protein